MTQQLEVSLSIPIPSDLILISKVQLKELQQKHQHKQKPPVKEWMNLKEGSAYAGVSYNTFQKFRERGLKISEVDGVMRVSKTEIDSFLIQHSY